MDVQRMQKLLNDLQSELAGGGSSATTDWRAEPGFPKLKPFGGSVYLLNAPLNPDWKGSSSFGGISSEGVRFLRDPSNADANHPSRSPAGYPLFYGIEGNGKNSDRMPARVMYDNQTHENDAKIEVYKRAVLGQGPASTDETTPGKPYTGALDPASLSVDDWRVYTQWPNLWAKNKEIFSSSEVGARVAQDTGSMAQRVDLSLYKAAGGKLTPWL